MRLASYNVENLFSRARIMNKESWDAGREILNEYTKLSKLLQKEEYSAGDKQSILASIEKLGLKKSDESEYVLLRQNKGQLLKRPKNKPPEVVAEGRDGWIGWLELREEPVNETATRMTAAVIKEVHADILAVVEAEDRISLKNFNAQLLDPSDSAYGCIMLIDGNDDRGIDVGLLTKQDYGIESIVSHVDDTENGSVVFSRDCPEYYLHDINGNKILVMINHLKSKGYGSAAQSDKKRKMQAERIRKIYELRKTQGIEHIAILGDFNDYPESDPLKPLLADGSDLKDVFVHPNFDNGGRPGTFGNCSKNQKIDYILLSPKLFDKVTAGGVCRKGVWGGTNGTLFEHFPEITKPIQAASDHAAVWVDIDMN